MSIFQRIKKGRIKKPLFMCLYSGPGVGKTDFGASFPSPLFFDFEESTHNINVERIDDLREFDDVIDGLNEILLEREGTLEFKSIIFDTIDELERLVHNQVAKDASKASIDHIGWQKGYAFSINVWANFISVCRQIRDKHKVHFCFLAHSTDRYKTDFEQDATHSRHSMNLHKKASEFIFGQVEMVLFAKKEVAYRNDKDGGTFAVDLDERTLCTALSVHYDAKNRIGLPPSLPMPVSDGFDVLWSAYNMAFDATPETVMNDCLQELSGINDEEKRNEIRAYLEKIKESVAKLKSCLMRIKEIKGNN